MKTLILDNKNWQLGVSTDDESDFSGVVGLSPDFKGQNYYASKGDSLCGQPALSNLSGVTFDSFIIAGIVDPTTTSRDALLVTQNGKYYYTYGSAITLIVSDSTDSGKYVKGKTDVKYFKGEFYFSKTDNITKVNSSLGYLLTWWTLSVGGGGAGQTAMNTANPHPMEVVEDTLYIADGNKINTWDGTTAVTDQFHLPSGYVITALRVHTDGRYLKIFATDTFDYNHVDRSTSKLFYVDTTTLEFVNSYDLEEQVEGVINYGGICFCTYGQKFGYFDGAGLKLIRNLDDTAITWSPFLSIFRSSVIFPLSTFINSYGDVNGKGNIFFFPYKLPSTVATALIFMLPISNTTCLIQTNGISGVILSSADFSNSGDLIAQTTKINPGGKVWMRRLDLFVDAMPSNSSINVYNRQFDGSSVLIGTISNSVDGAVNKKMMFCNVLTDFIQPYLTGTNAPMIKKINIQYESAE